MGAISLRRVEKTYGRGAKAVKVIHGVDAEIADGEFVVIVGPSGCGKSTLLRMVAGLEEITAGEIAIGGRVVNQLEPAERDIAMVFQNYALYPHMTVYDNMAYGLKIARRPKAEIDARVQKAAKILELGSLLDRKPRQLSGGQRQRVAMGRAIVRQPAAFLFDEPLSNLDAQLRGEMRTEIKRLHQRLKATIIYVTHDQVEAMTLADRIAVLQAGHRMQYDTPETVYNRPAALFVAGFTGAPAMNLVDCKVADGAADLGGERIRIPAPLADKARGAASLKFGIRPENIKLAAQGGDDLVVNAEVSLLEPLGSETLVTFKIGAAEMVARCGADFHQRPGTRLAVHMNPRHLHLFDAASGAALAH